MRRLQLHMFIGAFLASFLILSFSVQNASAQRIGSRLQTAPNTTWGCELAPIFDPITGAPRLAATGQTTCTFRNAGYIGTFQAGSYVPQNGFVTQARIRSGANPARLRVVVMQCSPGLCGTAVRFSRVLRPRANRITSFKMALKVARSSTDGDNGIQNITDAVGISVVGPGTLPLFDQGTAGTYTPGSALTQQWYPLMTRNIPRVADATMVDGLELLANFRIQRTRPSVN